MVTEDAWSTYDKGESIIKSFLVPYAIGRYLCLMFSKDVRKARKANREAVLAEISGLEEDIRKIDERYAQKSSPKERGGSERNRRNPYFYRERGEDPRQPVTYEERGEMGHDEMENPDVREEGRGGYTSRERETQDLGSKENASRETGDSNKESGSVSAGDKDVYDLLGKETYSGILDLFESRYGPELASRFDTRFVGNLVKRLNEKYGIDFSLEEAQKGGNKWLYDSLTSFLSEQLGEDFVNRFNQNSLTYLKLKLNLIGQLASFGGESRGEVSGNRDDLEGKVGDVGLGNKEK